MIRLSGIALLLAVCAVADLARAEQPDTAYIFPAGGQRGTKVPVRIGGYYLYERSPLELIGGGISGPAEITRVPTKWFEGPVIKQPASQQKEDYPKDYAAELTIAADAPLGPHGWRSWNAQGATPVRPFIVGNLPEVVEDEADGDPLPTAVTLPVTINGRIFPREDLDEWTFAAEAGKPITVAVMAEQLGSPLEARIEVRGTTGAVLAESTGSLNRDPQLRFTPPTSGQYTVRITDTRASGLQSYVYRLTITADAWIDSIYPLGGKRGAATKFIVIGQGLESLEATLPTVGNVVPFYFQHNSTPLNAVRIDLDDLEETREQEPNNLPEQAAELKLGTIANGRIEQPGDHDCWQLSLAKGDAVQLEVRAARLGSPLDAVLLVLDETGKELARGDDLPGGSPDCEVKFTAAKEGKYTVVVQERFASRGGQDFAYRLRCVKPTADFQLEMTVDSLAVDIGSAKKLPINITRLGGFGGAITLSVENLPAGVTAPPVEVKANQNKGEITFTCEATVPVSRQAIQIVGKADIDGANISRQPKIIAPPNNNNNQVAALGLVDVDHLLLVTSLATPFKFAGQFDLQYIARGSTLRKGFTIDRGGFEGPLWVELSDKQGRHLQGVVAARQEVPPGSSDFEFEVSLPPWMELGRTSRSQLMIVGELADAAGKKHKVSFTTNNQNDQMIALVSPGPLRVAAEKNTLAIRQGEELIIPLQITCDRTVSQPLKIELLVPEHMRDLTAATITVQPQETVAKLILRCGAAPGPLNMPLTIRATSERNGKPITSEAPLTLLLQP